MALRIEMISTLYLNSSSHTKPLRIGVVVNDFSIESVFRQVLVDIEESDFANLELVIVNSQERSRSEATSPLAGKLSRFLRRVGDRENRRLLLYEGFQKYNRRRLNHPNNPLAFVDCTDILHACKRLDVNFHTLSEAVASIQACDLDVILCLGINFLGRAVSGVARYGVWSHQYGDNEFYRGGPPLFWEVIEDNPCSGVILRVLTETPHEGLVLCKSVFETARGLWPSRNLFQPYWSSTHFVIRKLHALHELGWSAIEQQAVPPTPYKGKAEIYRAPNNLQMLKWLVPEVGKELNRRHNPWRAEKADYWRICLRSADSPGLLTGQTSDKSGFRWMKCPRGHYFADPILFQYQGQTWVFFEDYIYEEKRGRISCAPVQSDLSTGEPIVCLDLSYHLSYPLLFHHDGEIFMIPESNMNGSVELWRATNFPFAWKLEKILFKGLLVDTTPVLHGGRWYFFTALLERYRKSAFGALFSSDGLTQDWVRHPSCPISTDIRDARSAGAILPVGNRLLRPVQDCAERYGRRIHIDEILELSPDAYSARRTHSIEPDWDRRLKGVHTYAFCPGFEVLDAVSREDPRGVTL